MTLDAAAGVFSQPYDVVRDGRFLIDTELQDVSTEAIHLLMNWNRRRNRGRSRMPTAPLEVIPG